MINNAFSATPGATPPHDSIDSIEWQSELDAFEYAYAKPSVDGDLKTVPEDFKVTEVMPVIPSGEGEHYWLDISKVKCNTEQVAKALARFSGVKQRDVGFSGMKDFFAQTQQWFSVWKPKGGEPDWQSFKLDGVTIEQVIKHTRKIKRGTHKANLFEITIQNLTGSLSCLDDRLNMVKENGVPNYFGPQRFGNNAANMNQAVEMLVHAKKIKNRNMRGILLSSARSWLFNCVVSERIKKGTWRQLHENEPANLNGSNSTFNATLDETELARLRDHDIHPTAPMWGQESEKIMQLGRSTITH